MFYRKNLIDGRLESRNVEFSYSDEWEIIEKTEYDMLIEKMQINEKNAEDENAQIEDDMAAMLIDLEYRTTLLELNADNAEV